VVHQLEVVAKAIGKEPRELFRRAQLVEVVDDLNEGLNHLVIILEHVRIDDVQQNLRFLLIEEEQEHLLAVLSHLLTDIVEDPYLFNDGVEVFCHFGLLGPKDLYDGGSGLLFKVFTLISDNVKEDLCNT